MFKAAFYETELTPPLGYFLPGGGNRYATDVRDKVYAKAVVISILLVWIPHFRYLYLKTNKESQLVL